ncbi:hypothetical protein ILYODFUR_025477 [Ilyodon furcidens]|uniref:Uncharacterized protein n=1 Tax=Ilyodon furcidens TaxID=33524 RepID=A0ABV0SP86_9TELE
MIEAAALFHMTEHPCEHYVKYVAVLVPAGHAKGGEPVFFSLPSLIRTPGLRLECLGESRLVSVLLEAALVSLFGFLWLIGGKEVRFSGNSHNSLIKVMLRSWSEPLHSCRYFNNWLKQLLAHGF